MQQKSLDDFLLYSFQLIIQQKNLVNEVNKYHLCFLTKAIELIESLNENFTFSHLSDAYELLPLQEHQSESAPGPANGEDQESSPELFPIVNEHFQVIGQTDKYNIEKGTIVQVKNTEGESSFCRYGEILKNSFFQSSDPETTAVIIDVPDEEKHTVFYMLDIQSFLINFKQLQFSYDLRIWKITDPLYLHKLKKTSTKIHKLLTVFRNIHDLKNNQLYDNSDVIFDFLSSIN